MNQLATFHRKMELLEKFHSIKNQKQQVIDELNDILSQTRGGQSRLAKKLAVHRQRVNQVLRGKEQISDGELQRWIEFID